MTTHLERARQLLDSIGFKEPEPNTIRQVIYGRNQYEMATEAVAAGLQGAEVSGTGILYSKLQELGETQALVEDLQERIKVLELEVKHLRSVLGEL